jgi:hypothetical protein
MKRFRSALTALIPEGWIVRESIEFGSPKGEGYVVAASDTLPSALTTDEYAERYGKQLGERLPEYEELQVETITRGPGETAVIRSLRWSPPQGEPVAELHLYAVQDGRGIIARACSRAEAFGELEPKLRALVTAVGMTSPAPRVGVLRVEDTPRTRTYAALETGQLATTPARAFGFEPNAGEEAQGAEDEVEQAWKQARAEWRRTREER